MKITIVAWLSAAVLAVSVTAAADPAAAPVQPQSSGRTAPAVATVAEPAVATAPAAKPAAHKVTGESSAENRAGFSLMKERKYAEAIARFQKAVQTDPLNKTAWNSLGVCQLKMYETGMSGTPALESALAAFQKVAEIDPAYHAENLSNAQALAGQEKAWGQAAAKRAGQPARTVALSGDYRAYKAAGDAAEQEGDIAFAQANYEKAEAVAGSPKGKSAAANWQGLLALNKGRDPRAAVEHLRRATTLDPAYKYAWNNLGVALRRLYDAGAGGKELIEEAVAAFRKVSEIDPAYKPENLAEADALLTELGGPSAPAAPQASATTTAPAAEPAPAPAAAPAK